MSYEPRMEQLRGLSRGWAEHYGKPHLMASYRNASVRSHRADDGAFCAVCGKKAGSVHHTPPIGHGTSFAMATSWGVHVLKPALFALCGSGTTGCHGKFHSGLLRAEWVWATDEDARAWWEGELLKRQSPHGAWLFMHGWWRVTDAKSGMELEFGRSI